MTTPPDELHPVVVHHIVNSLGWPSLRPFQQAATAPLLAGDDALLIAPTAGGKTEAAAFPLLSRMANEDWRDTSLLYLCPLKALLNNLLPRLERYAGWLGRTVAVWHGDVKAAARRRILSNRPDVLLTTPESLEAMLVSANVDHQTFLAQLRVVVVDEVHAFADDDRGWHLLAVLERLTRVAGRPLQRVGLSATVGNPDELLGWLQGSGRGSRPARLVAPQVVTSTGTPPGDIDLDYVGSVENAAKMIAALHRGEKRLVFCDSRQLVEQLGAALRMRNVTTFLSHASLSADQRRQAEEAFAQERDCVIVATSTLELGIDVGDLDRVIQINAPLTVAAFLQRLGRTGRRTGSTRNCLFLALDPRSLVRAAALLLLWSRGWVEPVQAPPEPRHIVAQQILALCLQQHQVGDRLWREAWNGLEPFGASADVIVRYLVDHGFVSHDNGMLFIGPEAEAKFGHRHFMNMTASFTAPPEFTVMTGRTELGRTDPSLLTDEVKGPRLLLLGGRSWRVTYIDWTRRRCFVEPADGGGRARWTSDALSGLSYHLTRAMREVLLGADPPVRLSARATTELAATRDRHRGEVHPAGTVIARTSRSGDEDTDLRWWTWAGFRANATLVSTLSDLVDPAQRFDDCHIRMRADLTVDAWRAGIADAADRLCLPEINPRALAGLKFSAALPDRLATATLAARLADFTGSRAVLNEPIRYVTS